MAKNNFKKRIKTDPAFARTRENMSELGTAAKAGKLINDAFRMLAYNASDSDVSKRLTSAMSKVIKTDTISARGRRNVAEGDVLLLRGFEFNTGAKLSTIFFAPYTTAIDRAAGTLNVSIPEFQPGRLVDAPPGTTHFSVMSAAAVINFATGTYTTVISSSTEMVFGEQLEPAFTLNNTLTANSTFPLFLAIGVKFFQLVNGLYYQLQTGNYNAVQLVDVNVATQA